MTQKTNPFEPPSHLIAAAVERAGGVRADVDQFCCEINVALENLAEGLEYDLSSFEIDALVREAYRQAFLCLLDEHNLETVDWMKLSFHLLRSSSPNGGSRHPFGGRS